MKRTILSATDAAWLANTIERNRARFGGWSMMADDEDAGDKADEDQGEDADEDDGDSGADKDDEDDWKAKYEAQQRINRQLERKTRRDLAKIKQLEGGKPVKVDDKADDEKPDVNKIRADAKAEAAREVLNGRVEDKIEAKARAFADPEDAMAVLLRSHDIDDFIDDGKVDVEAITDALGELAEKKPHLLAQGGKKFQGDGDGGTRKETKGRPKTLGDAVARHYQ